MKRRTTQSKRRPVECLVGDYVLISGGRASMPVDWFFGTVTWVGTGEILVRRNDMTGTKPWSQIIAVEDIRAVGTIAALVKFKTDAIAAVRKLNQKVNDAETALGAARDAVWTKLDEIGATARRLSDVAEAAQ